MLRYKSDRVIAGIRYGPTLQQLLLVGEREREREGEVARVVCVM